MSNVRCLGAYGHTHSYQTSVRLDCSNVEKVTRAHKFVDVHPMSIQDADHTGQCHIL